MTALTMADVRKGWLDWRWEVELWIQAIGRGGLMATATILFLGSKQPEIKSQKSNACL